MSLWMPLASKMDAASEQADIAKTIENFCFFMVLVGCGDSGGLKELWIALLVHWMASGWLAGGLAGSGRQWLQLAGRLAGHRDPMSSGNQVGGCLAICLGGPEPQIFKKPITNPTVG